MRVRTLKVPRQLNIAESRPNSRSGCPGKIGKLEKNYSHMNTRTKTTHRLLGSYMLFTRDGAGYIRQCTA